MALKYTPRTYEAAQERATQRGGAFDSWIKQGVTTFKAKVGLNTIRFIPIPDEVAKRIETRSYTMDVYVHYNIGGDKNSYVCLEKMFKKRCPVCDYRRRLEDEKAPPEEIKDLQYRKAACAYVVDRDDEKAGVKFWPMSYTMDKKFNQLSIEENDKTLLIIEDPDKGYDCSFHREGTTVTTTKYTAEKIARNSSYLMRSQEDQDQVERWVEENPIDECIVVASEEDIDAAINGRASSREAGGDDRGDERRDARSERGDDRRRAADREPPRERLRDQVAAREGDRGDARGSEPDLYIDENGDLVNRETNEVVETASEIARREAAREPREPAERPRANGRAEEGRRTDDTRGEPRRANTVGDDPPTRRGTEERGERPSDASESRRPAPREPEERPSERRRPAPAAETTERGRGHLEGLRGRR